VRLSLPIFLISLVAVAQSPTDAARKSEQNPPVKVNVVNVCTPDADAQQQLMGALARLPKSPGFTSDYEISRGVATLEEGQSAKYVRLRREFKSDSSFATVQYSLSFDPASTIETLVFRGRDVKDLLALSIEDKLSTSVSKPAAVVSSDTPASRLRVERAGKTTLGLARCTDVDQAPYEPIFAQASATLAAYRHVMRLRAMLATDISWLNSGANTEPSAAHGTAVNPAKPAKSSAPTRETPH
jgi:hypothetical protein